MSSQQLNHIKFLNLQLPKHVVIGKSSVELILLLYTQEKRNPGNGKDI